MFLASKMQPKLFNLWVDSSWRAVLEDTLEYLTTMLRAANLFVRRTPLMDSFRK